MVDKIQQVCTFYESGYGHGLKADGLDSTKTSIEDKYLSQAYQLGYDAGYGQFKANKYSESSENDQDWSAFTVQYPQLIRELDNACHRKNWMLAMSLCASIDDETHSIRNHAIRKIVDKT